MPRLLPTVLMGTALLAAPALGPLTASPAPPRKPSPPTN